MITFILFIWHYINLQIVLYCILTISISMAAIVELTICLVSLIRSQSSAIAYFAWEALSAHKEYTLNVIGVTVFFSSLRFS